MAIVLIGTPFLDGKVHVETYGRLGGADDQFGIEDLKAGDKPLEIPCRDLVAPADENADVLGLDVLDLAAKTDLLEVKDDLGHILYHAGYGGELVLYPLDPYSGDGEAFERGKKHSAQGIADGESVSLFERTELESAFIVLGVDHHHFVRLLKV